jgi:uncharacterized damage-inducible protein DinB
MLQLIADLFQYQVWADSQLVAALKAHPRAAADDRIRELLHHIVAVQRYFLQKPIAGGPVPPLAEIEVLFRETAQLAPADDLPTDHLLQAVLHSQHHRGQIATRLRDLGGSPPTVDYIVWVRKRSR